MSARADRQGPPASRFTVHPGLAVDSFGYDRRLELQVLTDPQVRQAVATDQIRLVDYSFLTSGNTR